MKAQIVLLLMFLILWIMKSLKLQKRSTKRMRNITYKYSVGDYVRFKSKFTNPTCGLVWRAGTVAKITGIAKAYNNRPHYYVNGVEDEVFPESVFAGLAPEAAKNDLCRDEATVADNFTGPETKHDTEGFKEVKDED
jgi:hypothetical protein